VANNREVWAYTKNETKILIIADVSVAISCFFFSAVTNILESAI
jgi:hypothetical protein